MKKLNEYTKFPEGDTTPPEPRKDIPIDDQIEELKKAHEILKHLISFLDSIPNKHG